MADHRLAHGGESGWRNVDGTRNVELGHGKKLNVISYWLLVIREEEIC
jgi:hypothetical protein